jgi:hypothetical protein
VERGRFPVPPPSLIGRRLDLGQPASLSTVGALAGFQPSVPQALGPPAEVWVDRRTSPPAVSLVYRDGPLVTEVPATVSPLIRKFAGPDATVEQLSIDGRPAIWVEGLHEVALQGPSGSLLPQTLRLTTSALLVQHGDLAVRIETPAGRDEAIRIASSFG